MDRVFHGLSQTWFLGYPVFEMKTRPRRSGALRDRKAPVNFMPTLRRIIIVEDERDIADLVLHTLSKEGYQATVVRDGAEALSRIRQESFDLILLDLMLPGLPGMEICRMVRGNPATKLTPIIMLTARSEEVDRVLGLELGADDYITKPFSPRELLARIKAVLRRMSASEEATGRIQFEGLIIDPEAYTVTKNGQKVDLSATEFRLLHYLVQKKGRIFSRDQLLDAVWKDEALVEPRTVDVHIRRLRSRIEDDPSSPMYIKTRRGIGYYVEADL